MSATSLLGWLRAGWTSRGTHPALEDGTRVLDYAGLDDGVRRAARVLAQAGAGRGPVALIAGNSIEYVLAALGGLAAGRTVAEINPKETPERLRALLARLAPACVVTDRPAAGIDVAGVGPVLAIEEFARRLASAEPVAEIAPARPAAEPAFIVFTSGTTGLPKGVMLGEPGLAAVTAAILERLPIADDERYALVLPFNHTYGKSVLLTTLRAGGTVVLDPGFDDLAGFVRRLAERKITAFAGVPYHAQLLRTRAPLGAHDLGALRTLTISGGPMPPADLEDLAARLPRASVYFMYGLTECSTRATILPPGRRAAKPGSCGVPLACTRVRIVGEDGSVLPAEALGDVQLAGPNVMLGYWGEQDQTAAAFDGEWLRTGDIGRLDAEGFLFLSGRRDDLIKSAGERISAVEVEEALAAHPAVAEAAVRAVPHAVLGQAVGAWIVSREPGLTTADLVSHCAALLAPYKIPRTLRFVASLPRTASGKVQKHRLPLE